MVLVIATSLSGTTLKPLTLTLSQREGPSDASILDLWVRDQIASGKALETIRLHVERFRPPEAYEL
jgi:hypothetical protein